MYISFYCLKCNFHIDFANTSNKCFYCMIDMEWISTFYVGYQCIYNANRLREDIMQRRCSYLSYKLCKKKMEQNLHETTSRWKTYGKRLFSEDLEVQEVLMKPWTLNLDYTPFLFLYFGILLPY
jgi:hypothetical protein